MKKIFLLLTTLMCLLMNNNAISMKNNKKRKRDVYEKQTTSFTDFRDNPRWLSVALAVQYGEQLPSDQTGINDLVEAPVHRVPQLPTQLMDDIKKSFLVDQDLWDFYSKARQQLLNARNRTKNNGQTTRYYPLNTNILKRDFDLELFMEKDEWQEVDAQWLGWNQVSDQLMNP